jgi:hypothetical protein
LLQLGFQPCIVVVARPVSRPRLHTIRVQVLIN